MTEHSQPLADLLFSLLPPDGSGMGNAALLSRFQAAATAQGLSVDDADFQAARQTLVDAGRAVKGKGRGGSTARAPGGTGGGDPAQDFTLQSKVVPDAPPAMPIKYARKTTQRSTGATTASEASVLSYRHTDRRKNNPEVGLVNEASDPQQPKQTWAYDPHLDPVLNFDTGRAELENLIDDALAEGADSTQQEIGEIVAHLDHALAGHDEAAVREVVTNLRKRLANRITPPPERKALEEIKRRGSPYLQWTGKAERTSFDVDTVSLHVHERIDPMSILSAVRKRQDEEKGKARTAEEASPIGRQASLFEAPFESLPLRSAVDFYRHDKGWANRLIAGDSLQVMNSLLVKEGMAGQVQMIYIDPPYGIKYGSNFQPFVGKRDVKDRSDTDLTQEPEMIKAFRDTWELGVHSYLTYLRDRLVLARDLLSDSGSVFVQISDENVHHIREVMDEVFGSDNCVAQITFKKTSGAGSFSGGTNVLPSTVDYLVWYARDLQKVRYRQIFKDKELGGAGGGAYTWVQRADGYRRRMNEQDRLGQQPSARVFRADNLTSQTTRTGQTTVFDVSVNGVDFAPAKGGWKTNIVGMRRLVAAKRVVGLVRIPAQRDRPIRPNVTGVSGVRDRLIRLNVTDFG